MRRYVDLLPTDCQVTKPCFSWFLCGFRQLERLRYKVEDARKKLDDKSHKVNFYSITIIVSLNALQFNRHFVFCR